MAAPLLRIPPNPYKNVIDYPSYAEMIRDYRTSMCSEQNTTFEMRTFLVQKSTKTEGRYRI